MAAGVFHLWSKWEVQILVLGSFVLQVFLLVFARLRRRNIPPVLTVIIWLMYLSADAIAVYTLGHMSIGYKQADEQRQFMALWASLLLVHLGGQDTITAYAMEDNSLWLRHLFTLAVQAAGAAYVLYKYIPGSEARFMAAVILMFAIGVVKYGERVWSLKTANLESVSKFLDGVLESVNKLLGGVLMQKKKGTANLESVSKFQDGVEMQKKKGPYSAGARVDDEVVLQGAHDLLHICMGQFVDYNVLLSKDECDCLKIFYDEKKMYELVEMQLSLMYDFFYTKAVVVHTWHGLCIRAASLLGTVTACVLFQLSAARKQHGYSDTVDATVTQVLLFGACLLEVASVLVMLMSTWTCAALKSRGWHRLHRLLVSLRRQVKAAAIRRRWSGSIAQHNLVDSFGGEASLGSRVSSFLARRNSVISPETKELVLKEIHRMVEASGGNRHLMRSFRGDQVRLGKGLIIQVEFDESILMWHFATDVFLHFYKQQEPNKNEELLQATKEVSNYMMFLLVERPHMLPSPVRSSLYDAAKKLPIPRFSKEELFERIRNNGHPLPMPTADTPANDYFPEILASPVFLANYLLQMLSIGPTEVLNEVFRAWVEKLSYAANHCSRDWHARQLNSGGGEFITVVWLLTSVMFLNRYSLVRLPRSRPSITLS